MICNKKFHFVLPSKEALPMATCSGCIESCNGVEGRQEKFDLLEPQRHLMHGVMHSNGFGHLLAINGFESGSNFIPGYQIMDLWDRICTGLRARKVSLNDVAKKRTMELRLIHGVAYGEPWFGRWGYQFGRGSFGVTHQTFLKAMEAIRAMPLGLLVHHFGTLNSEIPAIIIRYQTSSGHSLLTLGHLFRFMLELKSRLPPETSISSDSSGLTTETSCRWSSKRVEMATRVIVEALKKAEFRWVSRQEVRDAARAYIGDTGLLDFVLKSLGNHIVGNYVVRRTVNPVTKVLEYCLQDISNRFPNQEVLSPTDTKTKVGFHVTKVQLLKDIFYLYKYILKEQRPTITAGIFATIPIAVRIILDTKQLVKDFRGELSRDFEMCGDQNLKLSCTIWLRNDGEGEGEGEGRKKMMPPHEIVILPTHATIGDLKKVVERSFREIYWGLRSFVAESVADFNGKDSDLVFGLIEPGCNLAIGGSIVENKMNGDEIYEGGNDNWVIDCSCGAKEDDGERMISCDICEVWQHTRCVRISNSEEIPNIFLCSRCEQDIVILPSLL